MLDKMDFWLIQKGYFCLWKLSSLMLINHCSPDSAASVMSLSAYMQYAASHCRFFLVNIPNQQLLGLIFHSPQLQNRLGDDIMFSIT